MFFYMSGTPRNDVYQAQENSLCSHRLFSLHGDYQRAVHKWLDYVLEHPGKPYPRSIMLDSGAFTAWNAGGEVTLDEVFDAYDRFETKGAHLFNEIWMVNLDKIPGKRGQDPTPDEIQHALDVSDRNYAKLVDRFGERILPVYHQGESSERALELASIAKYLCVSPRNDLHEGERAAWSEEVHYDLRKEYPDAMTHGLATTGNKMLFEVPWTSVDSAAWVLHAGFGKLDIFEEHASPRPRYRNYFVSNDHRKAGLVSQHLGARAIEGDEEEDAIVVSSLGDGSGLLQSTNMPFAQRKLIFDTFESYGFTLEDIVTNSRARSIVCMGELDKYCRWAATQETPSQVTLGFDR